MSNIYIKKLIDSYINHYDLISSDNILNDKFFNILEEVALYANMSKEVVTKLLNIEKQLYFQHFKTNSTFISKYDVFNEVLAFSKEIIYINEKYVYYLCQSGKKNTGYDDFHLIYDFLNLLLDRYEFPSYILSDIVEIDSYNTEKKSSLFRNVYNHGGCSWFWDEKYESMKDNYLSINKKQYSQEDFVEIDDLLNEGLSEEEIKYRKDPLSDYNMSREAKMYNHILVKNCERFGTFDVEKMTLTNINHPSLRKLLSYKYKGDKENLIKYQFISNINNDTFIELLYYFPEITLSFNLKESFPFYKNCHRQKYSNHQEPICVGFIKFRDLSLKLKKGLNFNNEKLEAFKEFLIKNNIKINIDNLLDYKEVKI